MKRKAKITGKSRVRAAASAARPCAMACGKASMHQATVRASARGAAAGASGCGAADRPSGVAAPVRAPAEEAAEREFREWIRRYEPVERAVYAERERREASRRRRAAERRRAFGDLCEMTEGLAAFAERNGVTLEEARRRLRRIRPFHPSLALPYMLLTDAWTGLAAMRRLLTRRIDRAKHEAVRPAYYAQERARRQALAAERRKVRMRHTLSPCPTRLEILDAWTKVKDSPEALLRFGSLMEDLECYVDNSLRRTEDDVIIGRSPGIKGWLQLESPALYLKYKTVMAYKAAAKRMRQVLDIRDPLPLAAALPGEGSTTDHGADEIKGRENGEQGTAAAKAMAVESGNGGRETAAAKAMAVESGNGERRMGNGERGKMSGEGDVAQDGRKAMDEAGKTEEDARKVMDGQAGTGGNARMAMGEADGLEALRARAVCAEVLAGIGGGHGMTTALLRRLGALTDPERVEDANMLADWREKYRRKITVRTKSAWGRRLKWTG